MEYSAYNYEKNVKVITTPNGDKVISMNKEIYTFLKNCVYDASEYQKEHDWDSTSEEVLKLWYELNKQ